MPEKRKPKAGSIALPIKWHFGDTATRLVTNLLVQCQEHETIISFFEVKPPILLGTPEENLAALKEAKSVRAECVARIGIATSRLQEFIDAIKQGRDNFLKTKGQEIEIKPDNGQKK
jgi:hypothetical protein